MSLYCSNQILECFFTGVPCNTYNYLKNHTFLKPFQWDLSRIIFKFNSIPSHLHFMKDPIDNSLRYKRVYDIHGQACAKAMSNIATHALSFHQSSLDMLQKNIHLPGFIYQASG